MNKGYFQVPIMIKTTLAQGQYISHECPAENKVRVYVHIHLLATKKVSWTTVLRQSTYRGACCFLMKKRGEYTDFYHYFILHLSLSQKKKKASLAGTAGTLGRQKLDFWNVSLVLVRMPH